GELVHAAEDVLIPVQHRASDNAAALGEQEDDEVGDLIDLPQLAHGKCFRRLSAPIVACVVEGALSRVLAFGFGPADVQAVDPDPVPAVGVGGVSGQPGQTCLRGDVGSEVGLPTVFGGGDDVDDRAG